MLTGRDRSLFHAVVTLFLQHYLLRLFILPAAGKIGHYQHINLKSAGAMKTLFDLARKLETKKLSSRQLVEHCLANIDDDDGEGHNTFISVYRDRALAEADDADRARKEGRHPSPFSGIPLSIKDLLCLLYTSPSPRDS